MAFSRVDGDDNLYIGGLWALRRSDTLDELKISHVLSMVSFDVSEMKNFKEEPWSSYGKAYQHLTIDVHDVEDEDLLIELPRAVRFIRDGLGVGKTTADDEAGVDGSSSVAEGKLGFGSHGLSLAPARGGGVFVHCAAGMSRSVSAAIAYLLWRYPGRFDPTAAQASEGAPVSRSLSSRRDTAKEAVHAALALIQQTRPMARPNQGFMRQLELWWEMGCPVDRNIEDEPIYQRWAYQREVEADLAVGQAPSRLRFEDEVTAERQQPLDASGLSLRCKKCRRALVTSQFFAPHSPGPGIAPRGGSGTGTSTCQHFFVEPLSWMRQELEKGELSGRLSCPNERCGAGVGRYDWKGFNCSCNSWVTPAFSLQKARVDEVVSVPNPRPADTAALQKSMGIRFPPGARGTGGNL